MTVCALQIFIVVVMYVLCNGAVLFYSPFYRFRFSFCASIYV